MSEQTNPIISFKNFSFQYRAQKKPTLHDINLDIYPGERVLIAGPSGSGKSTLAACINGLNPFSNPGECTGNLTVDGVDAPNSSIFELSAHVGTVLQDPDGQFIGLTVGEDIAFALENSCVPQKEMHEITRHAAELVGIEKRLDHAPHELSGGQKQRVSLAGVMVDQVKILMFDEPLASLDPATGKQAIELIDEIQHKTDTTVLIIEHRLEDVLWRNVDRIILVNEGTILADLRPDELLATHMLAENGIREPLYLTAMRYAGIAITPEKRPAHVDTVVLDDADTARLHKWFNALPLPEPGPAPEHLLEVRGLGFGYTKGQSTLHDISLSIGKGEMVSIVGRNGAGKSTLAKLICGFETPEQGQVLLNGRDLAQDNIRRRAQHIGYVMQNPNQMISKTMIFEEVALALQGSDMTQEQICQRVEDTLKVCGLYPFRNWPISALSFGQKKRVTIASVLVQQPELIILDEPTAGQDFRHYTDIMEFLRGLNEQGVTVVMITHDMHLMLEYTPRALVFCDGQLIADRSAAAVLCDPELIEQAALKETSLFTLANRCGIAPAEDFVERFIQDEHPQTIAMILSYLTAAQAAMVLGALPPEKQADVAKRIAMMDRTSPDVIKEVERVLERRLSSLVNQDYTIVGGVDAIVNILNTVDRSTEKHIMESLEIEEPELADEIRKKMFVFEDILSLDNRAIQRVLRDVDNHDLALALKGATEEVQNVILNNLSSRLASMIKEDMEYMGPVRMKDVEDAQQKIVNIIRKLEDSAEIVISRGGGDEIIV